MNLSGNQRRIYLLALALLIAAIALVCAWTLWRRPANSAYFAVRPGAMLEAEPSAPPEPVPEEMARADVGEAAQAEAAGEAEPSKMSTIVYYPFVRMQDNAMLKEEQAADAAKQPHKNNDEAEGVPQTQL